MKTILGLLLAAVGGIGAMIVAFVPRLGIGVLARLGQVNPLRRSLDVLGWLIIWGEWRRKPSLGRGLALLPGTLFAVQSQFLEPRRIFVDLVDPPHVTAEKAGPSSSVWRKRSPNPVPNWTTARPSNCWWR